MKTKRLLSVLLTLCMIMSVFPQFVHAADPQKWTYHIRVQISHARDSKSKNGNVKGHLYFHDGKQSFTLNNTKKTGKISDTEFTTTSAPWTLDLFEIENNTKDAFKILYTSFCVTKEGSDKAYYFYKERYPNGKGNKDGLWIERNKKRDTTYSNLIYGDRDISKAGNFDTFEETVFLDQTGASGTVKKEYDGKVTDQYCGIVNDGKEYDCRNMSDAPTMSFTVSGTKGNGGKVSKSELERNGSFAATENTGFKMDKAKLLKFMNDNNINMITVESNLKFPRRGANYDKKHKTTFIRKVFTIDNVSFSNNHYTNYYFGSRDNKYYNDHKTDSNGKKMITVEANIKTGGNNDHLSSDAIKDSSVKFDRAYLDLGGTGQVIEASEKSVKLDGTKFTLHFPYESGMDSNGNGLKLMFDNATLNPSAYKTDFKLYDEATKKLGYSYYMSTHKLDSKQPTITIAPLNGEKLEDWHKTIQISATPSETMWTFSSVNGRTTDGLVRMTLFDENGNAVQSCDYKGAANRRPVQDVPMAEGTTTNITLGLSEEKEGVFTLEFYGTDYAGNGLPIHYEGIHLDNKAPEVTLDEKISTNSGSGAKSNTYDVKITDASGTGRLYYCFSTDRYKSPEFDKDAAQRQESGEISSLLERWAFIDQSDKNASAYIEVEKGKNFNGRMWYFTEDAFGNRSKTRYKDIKIENEDASCVIEALNGTTKPSKSYTISITSNKENRITYYWKDSRGKRLTDSVTYNGVIDTSKVEETSKLDGTYILVCTVYTPSGKGKTTEKEFIFDSSGPSINARVLKADTYAENQTVSVYATDKAGVKEGFAEIVNPDGSKISGNKEFALTTADDMISQNVDISGIPSGAYALSVRATDKNDIESSDKSGKFFIRNEAPESEVSVVSDITYNDKPLISKNTYKLKLNVSEEFKNASEAGKQVLYYRVSDKADSFGEWIYAGEMEVSGDSFKLNTTVNVPTSAPMNGANYRFVQTAVYPDNYSPENINLNMVQTNELMFWYDDTPPSARLVIEDKHTSESISGKIYLSDNFDTEISLTASNPNIEVKRAGNSNEFDVTVKANLDLNTFLVSKDLAGNETHTRINIEGIDTEAPRGEIQIKEIFSGARKDGRATVWVNDAEDGNVKFAFIPESEFSSAVGSDGKVKDSYFDNYDSDVISIARTKATDSEWENEKDAEYSITVAGIDASYRIAVRATDSVGNSADIIAEESIKAENTPIEMTYTASPAKTDKKAVVKMDFNMPVYVLPQNRITSAADSDSEDAKSLEQTNLELAKQNAAYFTESSSFIISNNGTYKVYTVDDIGRTKAFEVTVNESDVEFGALGGLIVETYVGDRKIEDGEMAGLNVYDDDDGYTSYMTRVRVKPSESGVSIKPLVDDGYYWPINGLVVAWEDSIKSDDGLGYKEIVYYVSQFMDDESDDPTETSPPTTDEPTYEQAKPRRSNERLIELYTFADGNEDKSTWGTITAIVDNIDNTEPELDITYSPNILPDGFGMLDIIDVMHTPGNVTANVELSDTDSGIERVVVTEMRDEMTGSRNRIEVPLKDENGKFIDYSEKPWTYDMEKTYGADYPVTIEYYGDDNPKNVKQLKYTFRDNCEVPMGICFNGAGDRTYISSLRAESITSYNAIYKMPIEKNTDYKLKYYYETDSGDWVDMTDDVANPDRYYKRAKAVLEKGTRADERGLKVTTKLGEAGEGIIAEKILDSYEPSYTFKLKDKFGYTAEVTAELTNFDEICGTIEYSLSTTSKTRDPIALTVAARDNESGVGSVKLISANGETELTKIGEQGGSVYYSGQITENGSYGIVMYDKVGNKVSENFNVSNINKSAPTMTGYTLSTNEITSRAVTASLTFSKPNVRIKSVEPLNESGLQPSQYSVNYSTSSITFTESGTLSVFFEDDYGNEGAGVVTVDNIDKTPPTLDFDWTVNEDKTEITVKFKKVDGVDERRRIEDIIVSYGGAARSADEAEFKFGENGSYTFKVYDKDGISAVAYMTLEVTDIDKSAPNITEVRWSYEYEALENGTWQKKTANHTITNPNGAGYVAATDIYPVTNQDVEVTVVTDAQTRQVGTNGEYSTENTKPYTDNGMYIFNLEKNNRQTASYGIDIELIDKVPPVIDLLGKNELIFYENADAGEKYNKDMLTKPGTAFNAYDKFGKGTDLNNRVTINYNGFNPDDITQNVFDSSIPYTITYQVSDNAHNVTEVKRTIRLIGMYDTIALVNGKLPDFAGRSEVEGDSIAITLKNFADSGTAYVRYQSGMKTMGQMKKEGTMLSKNENGEFKASGLSRGWYTFFVQTDKRDYFTLQIYLYN